MRILVTGVGCVSALGLNCQMFAKGLRDGAEGISALRKVDTSNLKVKFAGEIHNYEPLHYFSRSRLAEIDLYAQYALISAREAVATAKLVIDRSSSDRICVIHGTGVGGQVTTDGTYRQVYGEKVKRVHPFTIPKLMPCAAASQISIELGITGPVFSTTSACASAGHSIAMGVCLLRSGLVDVALVGGAEAALTYGSVKAWEALRIMSHDTCRPFSLGRSGMVLGEGAGTMVLESEDSVRSRGASALIELAGIGMSADASNLIKPDAVGMARAIRASLHDAMIPINEISYVNAHGTGTASNDPCETTAICEVFGSHSSSLAVSSTKSQIGHTLGAAGALEAIATVISLQEDFAPPTIGYLGRAPDCHLDYVPNQSRPMKMTAGLSNSFAFGGLNTAIIFRKLAS